MGSLLEKRCFHDAPGVQFFRLNWVSFDTWRNRPRPLLRWQAYGKYVVVRGVKLDRGPFDHTSDESECPTLACLSTCSVFKAGQGASSAHEPS